MYKNRIYKSMAQVRYAKYDFVHSNMNSFFMQETYKYLLLRLCVNEL